MEWTIKLEARSGWGEVETIEVARLNRRVVGGLGLPTRRQGPDGRPGGAVSGGPSGAFPAARV